MLTQRASESLKNSRKGKLQFISWFLMDYVLCSLADKIPNLIEKLKKEGKDESSIQDMIEQKKIN